MRLGEEGEQVQPHYTRIMGLRDSALYYIYASCIHNASIIYNYATSKKVEGHISIVYSCIVCICSVLVAVADVTTLLNFSYYKTIGTYK